MRKTETVTVGSNTFQITQLGALQGRKVFLRLVKVLGPALSAAQAAASPEAALGALLGQAGAVSEEDFEYLCDVFSEHTELVAAGKSQRLKEIFDVVFIADYKGMLEWLGASVKVNFASFFDGLAATSGLPG